MSDELDKALQEVSQMGEVTYRFKRRSYLKRWAKVFATMDIGDELIIPEVDEEGWPSEVKRYNESNGEGKYFAVDRDAVDGRLHVRRIK